MWLLTLLISVMVVVPGIIPGVFSAGSPEKCYTTDSNYYIMWTNTSCDNCNFYIKEAYVDSCEKNVER